MGCVFRTRQEMARWAFTTGTTDGSSPWTGMDACMAVRRGATPCPKVGPIRDSFSCLEFGVYCNNIRCEDSWKCLNPKPYRLDRNPLKKNAPPGTSRCQQSPTWCLVPSLACARSPVWDCFCFSGVKVLCLAGLRVLIWEAALGFQLHGMVCALKTAKVQRAISELPAVETLGHGWPPAAQPPEFSFKLGLGEIQSSRCWRWSGGLVELRP